MFILISTFNYLVFVIQYYDTKNKNTLDVAYKNTFFVALYVKKITNLTIKTQYSYYYSEI